MISVNIGGLMFRPKSSPRKNGKVLLFLLVLFILAATSITFGPRYIYRFFGYLWLDRIESRLTEKQIKDIQNGLQGLKGKIVWSSSRTGNHELFVLTLPDLNMYQLTHNKYVDFFSRFSPKGDQILFCRSQRPWVSGRDLDSWDVYLFNFAGNRERLIVRDALWPQWINDTQFSFVRRKKVFIKDLLSGREEMVLDATQEPILGGIETPEFLQKDPNFLACTGRGKMDGVFVLDRAKNNFIKIGQGCQITWVPDGQEVVWMDNGGNGGNHILVSSIAHIQQKVFMDLPGKYSHEYFPRLSRDGKWLVWGAAAEGHEHDIADYEIFLWKVGAPFSQALRLTYNAANDNWPDIFLQN
jgi:Tol biopolymer transport system component